MISEFDYRIAFVLSEHHVECRLYSKRTEQELTKENYENYEKNPNLIRPL